MVVPRNERTIIYRPLARSLVQEFRQNKSPFTSLSITFHRSYVTLPLTKAVMNVTRVRIDVVANPPSSGSNIFRMRVLFFARSSCKYKRRRGLFSPTLLWRSAARRLHAMGRRTWCHRSHCRQTRQTCAVAILFCRFFLPHLSRRAGFPEIALIPLSNTTLGQKSPNH